MYFSCPSMFHYIRPLSIFTPDHPFGFKVNAYSYYFCPHRMPRCHDEAPRLQTIWTVRGDPSCRSAVCSQELVREASPVLPHPRSHVWVWVSSAHPCGRSMTMVADCAALPTLRDGAGTMMYGGLGCCGRISVQR
jgi:hypothetical protein